MKKGVNRRFVEGNRPGTCKGRRITQTAAAEMIPAIASLEGGTAPDTERESRISYTGQTAVAETKGPCGWLPADNTDRREEQIKQRLEKKSTFRHSIPSHT